MSFSLLTTSISALHHGIKVRINIDDPRFASTQATLNANSSNTFRVPSDSGDYLDYSDDQDGDDLTPRDNQDNEHQDLTIANIVGAFPTMKHSVGDDAAHPPSSGLSQLDPVIIDDDMSMMNSTSSRAQSPTAKKSKITASSCIPVEIYNNSDMDEEDDEVEYHGNPWGEDDDDDGYNSADRDDESAQDVNESDLDEDQQEEDEVEEAREEPSSEVSDDNVIEAHVTQPEPELERETEPEPATSPIQSQTHQGRSFFSDGRVLPDPSLKLAPVGASAHYGSTLPRIADHLSQFATAPSTLHPQSFGQSYSPYQQSLSVANKDVLGDKIENVTHAGTEEVASDWNNGYMNVSSNTMTAQSASWDNAAASGWSVNPLADNVASVVAKPDATEASDGMKRKRDIYEADNVDVEAADQVRSNGIGWDTLLNAPNATEKRHDSASEGQEANANEAAPPANANTAMVGKQMDAGVGASSDATAPEPEKFSRIAVLRLPRSPASGREKMAAVEERPRKRLRSDLVLTAAVGAFGGCVATFGLLWSPLAERLLA